MRLSGYVQFSRLGSEIMAACILQNLAQFGGGAILNGGNVCWRVSTKVK